MNVTDSEGNRLELDAHIERSQLRQGVSLYLYAHARVGRDQDVYILPEQTILTKDNIYNPSRESRDSFVFLPEEAAQNLITELWYAGYRPKGVTHGNDTIAVLQDQVKQVRVTEERLFNLLDKVLKP
jgi:hypothetical protein